MIKQYQGELRAWEVEETWKLVLDEYVSMGGGEDVHPQFRDTMVAEFPGPKMITSEQPGQLVATVPGARGPRGEEALVPDFDHPFTTISVPAWNLPPRRLRPYAVLGLLQLRP